MEANLAQSRVSGKWVMTPHTLNTRRSINKLLRSDKEEFFLERDDYVQALHEHLAGSNKKRDLNRLSSRAKISEDTKPSSSRYRTNRE